MQYPRKKRDFVKLIFSIKEDTFKIKKTAEGTYTVSFNYDSDEKVTVSFFTHVIDHEDLIHSITQNIQPGKIKGTEKHNQCKPGKNCLYKLKNVKIDINNKNAFSKEIKEKNYPMMIRMVKN